MIFGDSSGTSWLFPLSRFPLMFGFKSSRPDHLFAVSYKAKVWLFRLAWGNLTAEKMAEAFLKGLPKIIRFVRKHPPPFIAGVTRGGNVSMLER